MKGLSSVLRFIFLHPLTRKDKFSTFLRFLKWQLASRIFAYPVLWPYVGDTSLLVKRGMTGATGNIYTGLHEFEEMGFLLHLLRPGDLFGDIGANVGSYTILASGVSKAESVSVEPVTSTFINLKNNVAVNNLESKVRLFNAGVGDKPGKLYFTRNHDTVNHVLAGQQPVAGETEEVNILTLDQLFAEKTPVLLKIDVEGFELSVLRGAKGLLPQQGLKGIIIEINGSCNRYGATEEDIHMELVAYGFAPFLYEPLDRRLTPVSSYNPHGNTIYIRDEEWVRQRLAGAEKVRVFNQSF
jgi:FkbM family methyltransferase